MNLKEIIQNLDIFRQSEWDLSNKILYDICEKYPSNYDQSSILAKALIIGRTYAVALERRKVNKKDNVGLINDDFYVKAVTEVFKGLKLDDDINTLKNWDIKTALELSNEQLKFALQLHKKLSDGFFPITGLTKRSFASKYLHFHLKDIFFIYDSRAESALSTLYKEIDEKSERKSRFGLLFNDNIDQQYLKFYIRCLNVLEYIKEEGGVSNISPRELDNILIEIANEKIRK